MSSVISGGLVLTAILATTVLMAMTLLGITSTQATAWETALNARNLQQREGISITSTLAASDALGTDITVNASNSASGQVSDFEGMDVLVEYTSDADQVVTARLTYVSGAPADNEWTVTSLSPDTFHPGIWDSDEAATLDLRVSPPVKAGTNAVVAVVTPRGATDMAYVGA